MNYLMNSENIKLNSNCLSWQLSINQHSEEGEQDILGNIIRNFLVFSCCILCLFQASGFKPKSQQINQNFPLTMPKTKILFSSFLQTYHFFREKFYQSFLHVLPLGMCHLLETPLCGTRNVCTFRN